MPAADDSPPAQPNGTTSNESELEYYKTQYEQLEAELADFQVSSRELEAELEKDIEAAEKRERQLKEKVDSLRYEVDEWKAKCKQAKSEANSVQGTLQKEITGLRDANRTLQLKLRDIEVANDDYERQARNTTSSLEDLESKYNVAIERGVLLEEEIRSGEQERENLRVENQRLRDELTDLRIEAEILQEKLRHAEFLANARRKPAPLSRTPSAPHTPDVSELSPRSGASSPLFSATPMKYSQSVASGTATPPSPPISEASTSMRKSIAAAPGFPRQRASVPDPPLASRSLHVSKAAQRYTHSRTTSLAYSNGGRSTPSVSARNSISRLSLNKANGSTTSTSPGNKTNAGSNTNRADRQSGIPTSGSLQQIRGLIGKMQRLEQRVQYVKSRLPAPAVTPVSVSPRTGAGSALGESSIPSSVTMRRASRKRISGSSFSSSVLDVETTPSQIPRSRQSVGSRTQGDSRPSSRTSYTSSISHNTHPSASAQTRPESRQSLTGRKTPLGHHSANSATEGRRPRSSLSNHAGLPMSHIEENEDVLSPTPTQTKMSGIRRPSISYSNGLGHGPKKRPISGVPTSVTPRTIRTTSGVDRQEGNMPPPERKPTTSADLGETY